VRPTRPPFAVHGNCANASADHADVIGGGVGSSVSRPEQERQRFPGAPGAVVAEREQRVKPKASLVGRGGVFLLQLDQARIQIDDQRVHGVHPVIGGVGTGPRPRGGAVARLSVPSPHTTRAMSATGLWGWQRRQCRRVRTWPGRLGSAQSQVTARSARCAVAASRVLAIVLGLRLRGASSRGGASKHRGSLSKRSFGHSLASESESPTLEERVMYKLIACWSAPRPEDEAAFEEHYREVHLPAAAAAPGIRRLVAVRTDSGLEGGASAFYRVAELHFDSKSDLETSESSAEWAAMRADAGGMIERFGVTLSVGMGEEHETELTSV